MSTKKNTKPAPKTAKKATKVAKAPAKKTVKAPAKKTAKKATVKATAVKVAAPIFANGPTRQKVAERLGGITDKVLKAHKLVDAETGRPVKGKTYTIGKGKNAVTVGHKGYAIHLDRKAFIEGLSNWAKGKGWNSKKQVEDILAIAGVSK